jgi:hypothetical protein
MPTLKEPNLLSRKKLRAGSGAERGLESISEHSPPSPTLALVTMVPRGMTVEVGM